MSSALMFPGQGSQYVKMGKDIYDSFTSAKSVFDEVNDALAFKLTDVIFGDDENELRKTTNTQPALMATSVAIYAVLKNDFNKDLLSNAQFVFGHSLGEYSALCVVGALSLSDTARILKVRASLMESAGSGSMAAVIGLSMDGVVKMVDAVRESDVLVIANDNSDGQIVISGSVSAIKRACEKYKDFGAKRCIELPVSGAFHSPFMKEKSEEFASHIANLNVSKPRVPLISNVKAEKTDNPDDIKSLLATQLYSPVRWRESVAFATKNGVTNFYEIGAKNVLTGLSKRNAPDATAVSIDSIDDIKNFASQG